MDDLISRQAALKELAVYIHLIDKTMGKGTLTDDDCMEAAKSVLGEDELPAVQPDHNADIGKKVCVDTISRQAALDTIMGQPPEPHYPTWYAAQIEKLPAAQPEIIHCRECKHWKQQTNYAGAPLSFGFCESDDMWRSLYGETYEVSHIDTDDDFYCGFAERRTDE